MRIIGNDPNTPRQTQVVASGTLSTGDTIVVNSDGTVSAVAETNVSQSVGTPAEFTPGGTTHVDAVYDTTNDKVVLLYRDNNNSSYGTAVVGTVSGQSISFGTPVVFESGTTTRIRGAFDESVGAILVAYRDNANSSYGTAVPGVVSGTSISFGTPAVFNSNGLTSYISIAYNPPNGRTVIVYRDHGNNDYGTAVVANTDGSTVSFGTPQVFNSSRSDFTTVSYNASVQKHLILWRNFNTSGYGQGIVGTVSSANITFGGITTFEFADVEDIAIAYDSDQEAHAVFYADRGNSGYGTAVTATISASSITFGSPVVYEQSNIYLQSATYDPNAQKVVVIYSDVTNSYYGTGAVGTVDASSATITFGTPFVFEAASTAWNGTAYDPDTKTVVFAYVDQGNSSKGTYSVFQNAYTSQNLTSENYIGTAKSGAADGDGVVVNTQGNVSDIPVTYYDIANASYDSVSFSVTSQDESPQAFAFSADGTKMYVGGSQNNTVYQYTLSTAWDLSTASYASKSFSYSGQETAAQDIAFKTDGTKMFITGTSSDAVNEYALSTAWDVSTASFTVAFSVSSQDVSPQGVTFNPNGTQMYVTGNVSNAIFEYTLSTAWDVSSASYASKSLSVGTEEGEPRGVEFNSDGTQLFITGSFNDNVSRYDLTTAYDVSTGSYADVSFAISEDGESRGPKFKSDGSKMYILGFTNDSVFQYTILTDLTAGQSYYVQTDGTLSTTAGDPSVFAGTAVSATKLIVKG